MESLAIAAAVVFLTVALSGPLALLATSTGFIYIGGTVGLVAIASGLWFASVMHAGIGWVGLASASMGAWCVLQAWRGNRPE